MEKISVSTQLLNGILQYLGSRPYTEVANLIAAIQAEAKAQADAKAQETLNSTPTE